MIVSSSMMKTAIDMATISETLAAAGMNPTAQRIAVFQYLCNHSDHPTPEQVKAAVDQVFPKISLATIYNTLNALVSAGLILAVKLPHSGKIVYDVNTSKHYHFIDEKQGLLVDLDPRDVQIQLGLPPEYEVEDIDVFIKGHLKT